MGSNMQRQAVPLIFTEPPRVGTGMEQKSAYDSGVLVKASRAGVVDYVARCDILIKPDDATRRRERRVRPREVPAHQPGYLLHPAPVVRMGERSTRGSRRRRPGDPARRAGPGPQLAPGFVPWNGYNYEDAILICERVVKEDMFTSIHIKEFSDRGPRDEAWPGRSPATYRTFREGPRHLDDEGIIRIGAKVKAGAILVGKVTPKSETETTPEFKLLNSIFGEKAKDVNDSCLRVPTASKARSSTSSA